MLFLLFTKGYHYCLLFIYTGSFAFVQLRILQLVFDDIFKVLKRSSGENAVVYLPKFLHFVLKVDEKSF